MWWVRRTSSDFFRDRMAKTHSILLSSWMILKRSSLIYLSFPTDIRLTSSWRTHETWNKRNVLFLVFIKIKIHKSKKCLLLSPGLKYFYGHLSLLNYKYSTLNLYLRWLNLIRFFHFDSNLQKWVPNHDHEHLLFKWIVLWVVIWHPFLEIWAKVKKILRLSHF